MPYTEMDETRKYCGVYGREEKQLQNFWLESLEKTEDLEEPRWKNNVQVDLNEIGRESVERCHRLDRVTVTGFPWNVGGGILG